MEEIAKGPSATKADKNPKGGLSAKGRKKFGVQKGVTNYSSASRKDKGRWVSWAMRFTGTPKPVKDDKGQPTRYALMFRAWGEKVPTSVADVKAVHAKAVKRSKELKNADQASDQTPEGVECSDCDRSFLIFPALLDHVSGVHLDFKELLVSDNAHSGLIGCTEEGCDRAFMDRATLLDHAEAVHTFSDVERLVSEAVREKYGRRGDYRADPPIPSIYCWVNDLADDWVVFTVEGGAGQINETLYKASYSITENTVTLGDPVEVVRRTVYEAVKA